MARLSRKEVNALNNGSNWVQVGMYCESVHYEIPDLIPTGGFSYQAEHRKSKAYEKTCAFMEEITHRLNHYPELVKEVESLRKANLKLQEKLLKK